MSFTYLVFSIKKETPLGVLSYYITRIVRLSGDEMTQKIKRVIVLRSRLCKVFVPTVRPGTVTQRHFIFRKGDGGGGDSGGGVYPFTDAGGIINLLFFVF